MFTAKNKNIYEYVIFLLGSVPNKNIVLMSGHFVGQSIPVVTFWDSFQIDLSRLQAMLLLASFEKLVAATCGALVWQPAREGTVCLKAKMAAPEKASIAAAMASVISELESVMLWRDSKEPNLNCFSMENGCLLSSFNWLQEEFDLSTGSPDDSASLLVIWILSYSSSAARQGFYFTFIYLHVCKVSVQLCTINV